MQLHAKGFFMRGEKKKKGVGEGGKGKAGYTRRNGGEAKGNRSAGQ